MIRKQQQLRDKTFKQGQESRRDRQRGKQGDQNMGDLQQDQQGLRDRLKKLQQELAKRGMGQGQRGEKGERGEKGQQGQGQQGEQGDGEDGLGDADSAMGDATGRLARATPTARWTRGGRRTRCASAQSLAEAMQQGDGDQPGDGPGPRAHRERPTLPIRWEADAPQRIQRRLYGEDSRRDRRSGCAGSSKNAAPSRRPARPIELDYIERLLKDY
jgi:hypothetical protein